MLLPYHLSGYCPQGFREEAKKMPSLVLRNRKRQVKQVSKYPNPLTKIIFLHFRHSDMGDVIAQKITRVFKLVYQLGQYYNIPIKISISKHMLEWKIAMCLHIAIVQRECIDCRSIFRNISPTLSLWLATSQYWPSPVSGTPSMEDQIRGIFPIFLHQIEREKRFESHIKTQNGLDLVEL